MSGRRSTAGLAATVATLLLVGFAAGFFARPSIQGGIERIRGDLAHASRQKYLAAKFLGQPASDLPAFTVEGGDFRMSAKKGKVVLLFFWASWCPYSRTAIPAIQAVQERYAGREDFEIVGVSLDRDREALQRFAAEHGIRWTNLYDDGKTWTSAFVRSFEVRSMPSRWIIDRDLRIAGADLGQAAAEDGLSVLLEGRHRAPGPAEPAGAVPAGGCAAPDVR